MTLKTMTLTAVVALSSTAAIAEEVRVYNWSDYIDEALLEKFEAETGIDLIYDVFDSNELLETKMLAGGSGYDVVVPSGTFLQRHRGARTGKNPQTGAPVKIKASNTVSFKPGKSLRDAVN